jgi:hypothetical protein
MPRPWAFVSGVPLPDPPYGSHLSCVPIALLPLIIGALETRAASYVFAEGAAYYGIQLIRRTQVELITGCTELTDAIDRVYRLLDTNLTGAEYTATEVDGVITVAPPLPAAPAAPLRSLHSRLERLEYLLDNGLNGAEHLPDFGDTDGVRDLLRELIIAVQQAGPLDDDQLDRLTSLVGLLS